MVNAGRTRTIDPNRTFDLQTRYAPDVDSQEAANVLDSVMVQFRAKAWLASEAEPTSVGESDGKTAFAPEDRAMGHLLRVRHSRRRSPTVCVVDGRLAHGPASANAGRHQSQRFAKSGSAAAGTAGRSWPGAPFRGHRHTGRFLVTSGRSEELLLRVRGRADSHRTADPGERCSADADFRPIGTQRCSN